jgi:hypothetical protein
VDSHVPTCSDASAEAQDAEKYERVFGWLYLSGLEEPSSGLLIFWLLRIERQGIHRKARASRSLHLGADIEGLWRRSDGG